MTHILDLPIELLTIITTQDLETFKCALKTPSIGIKLCTMYAQNYAQNRFITIIKSNHKTKYYLCDRLHRDNGPAIECINGNNYWYRYGKLHRDDDKPAIKYGNGNKEWYWYGRRHREDGPALKWINGRKEWWYNGKIHREGKPAIKRADGIKEWYWYGERHREDGPVIEYTNGDKS